MTPTFDEDVTEYSANITDASTSVTATADTTGATVELFLNGTSQGYGTTTVTKSITWTGNTDTLTANASWGGVTKTYNVTVTHNA